MNELIEELKIEFSENHKKRLVEAEISGKSIGNEDLPEVNETHPHPFENTLQKQYEGDLNKLEQKCNKYIEQPYSDFIKYDKELKLIETDENKYIESLTTEINENLIIHKKQEDDKHKRILDEINDRDKIVQSEFNRAQEKLRRMQLKLDREYLNINFTNKSWYITILLSLAVAETPLNFSIFSQFRESNFSTLLMAATLIIGIPLGSHFCGLYLKRRKDRKIHIFISLLIFIFIVALSYYVGLQRADFMEKFPNINNSITLPTFFALTNFLFWVGTFLSYSHYDDSSEFQAAWESFRRQELIFNDRMPKIKAERKDENRRYDDSIGILNSESNNKIIAAKSIRKNYEELISKTKSNYDSNIKTLEAEAKNLISFCSEAISTFRRFNMDTRQNHKMPESFKTDPSTPSNPFTKFQELDPNDLLP